MLEESRMDKKSLNRSAQPQSRAQAVDSKKNSELTYKPWPRNNKKREGSGSVPKNEGSRKNVPSQRGRGQVDRRPRPRGGPGNAVGGMQVARVAEEDEPEIGSVFVPGSKKQNLNHLLNFMYPSRGQDRGMQPRRQNHHRVSFKHEPDLYIRAYCQFVVKEDGDYKVNLLDPDRPVKWEQIEEVVIRGTGRSECPICLGPPVAGRVGPCGHVYCWPCILHYAATHDKQPPPCPVCTTPIYVNNMKPTRIVQWNPPSEEVTMRLVRRLRGSSTVEIAPSRGQELDVAPTHILPLDNINKAPYCKLFAANKQQVLDILEREKTEIQNQILAEIDTTEIVFMEQALKNINDKIELNKNYYEPKKEVFEEEEVPIVYEKFEKNEENGNKLDWFDVTDDGAASIEVVQKLEELHIQSENQEGETKIESSLNPDAPEFAYDDVTTEEIAQEVVTEDHVLTDMDKQNQLKYFYFYQVDDGQQVFLHSFNVRMLNATWGILAAAPPVIRGKVLHRETFPLTEQTRKHMPCTAHLPLHCSFDIVEIDLLPPYVTFATLDEYEDEINKRARVRRLRARAEREERRRARRAMEGPPRPDFSSNVVFPPAKPPVSSPPLDPSPIVVASEASPTSVGSPPSGLSFAKMASTSGTWRVRKNATPPPPPPDEEEASAPRALVLSDAIEAALLAATPSAPTGKKKKKSKQKVLFTTGIQRDA